MRSFGDILGDLARGQTFHHLSERLAELANAVRETGRPGELTLTLKVKPNGTKTVMVSDAVKVKLPELPRPDSLFFLDDNGSLLRDDPDQRRFPFAADEAPPSKESAG